MTVDFTRDASGAAIVTSSGEASYLSGDGPVFITGKANAVRYTQPVIKAPQVIISWKGGSMKYWLDQIKIDGVQQTDLEACKLALATTIFNVMV
jgi:hypothetical protein